MRDNNIGNNDMVLSPSDGELLTGRQVLKRFAIVGLAVGSLTGALVAAESITADSDPLAAGWHTEEEPYVDCYGASISVTSPKADWNDRNVEITIGEQVQIAAVGETRKFPVEANKTYKVTSVWDTNNNGDFETDVDETSISHVVVPVKPENCSETTVPVSTTPTTEVTTTTEAATTTAVESTTTTTTAKPTVSTIKPTPTTTIVIPNTTTTTLRPTTTTTILTPTTTPTPTPTYARGE